MNAHQQKSNEWLDLRAGRFTGSQIHKLMGVKGLGQTGLTYAFEMACEIVFGRNEEEQFESFDIKRGNELEPFAFRKFKELKELDFIEVQNCSFFAYGNNAGASPDGLVSNDSVLEIKCPRPNKFFNLVAKGYDAIDSEYIDQMQMEMLATNSKQCHFFNYIIYNGEEMWHEIIVGRDDVRIELIKQRILEATIKRDEFVELLKNNIQWQ
jgi:putative phage-type endonuclease